MKAKTARPFLLVMLFGILASNGWMITEYGPGAPGTGLAPPSAARETPARNAGHGAPAAQTAALAPQGLTGTDRAARPDTAQQGSAAQSSGPGFATPSAPMLASATPVNPEAAPPSDPGADLAFSGPTNLNSGPGGVLGGSADGMPGGPSGGLPADPPVIGANPPDIASSDPPVSGGAPQAKELAEPGSLGLLAAGLILLGWMRRRTRTA